jgi:hypothetical protein
MFGYARCRRGIRTSRCRVDGRWVREGLNPQAPGFLNKNRIPLPHLGADRPLRALKEVLTTGLKYGRGLMRCTMRWCDFTSEPLNSSAVL